jgi:transposase/flagellar biosynthesis chaperone FliJ
MPTQLHLPTQPAGAEPINAVLALVREGDEVAYFASGVPVFVHAKDDAVGRRLAAVQMMELGLARQDELSAALQVDRSTLYRQQRKVKRAGVLGVVQGKRGPHGPHRFDGAKRERVQRLLAEGMSIRQAAQQVGVSEGTIRHALRRGELGKGETGAAPAAPGPAQRSARDARCAGGVAVQRHTERVLARLGKLPEAAPRFVPAEALRYGGALLGLPALLAVGLLEAGEQAYGSLKNGFYGLRATLLILAFMALLRVRTPEQLQGHPPGELGVLLGLDRAPEVKTLRRKLWELAARQRASQFSRALAQRWVHDNAEAVGLLYVDGHVRPYHGRAHRLPEAWVARRRLCMPATTDFWVNQQDAQPLLVITAAANDDLLAMLRTQILPEVRTLVGARRVTIVFDREGWSPKFFQELAQQDFDVLSYRKGRYAPWAKRVFRSLTASIDGRKVSYELAERSVRMRPGFRMREVRRLCASGHQTAIVTTRTDWPIEEVAYRMFERWTQENFFRYMRQHFALDALVSYAVEPADPQRSVPNPQRKALSKAIKACRAAVQQLEQTYGQQARANPEAKRRTMRGFKIAQAKLDQQIDTLQRKCRKLQARLRTLPKRVALDTLRDAADIVKLAPEAKHLSDTIKMVAYRAETALVRCLTRNEVRTEDEGRALVREMLLSSADIVPQVQEHRLLIRVHSLANPRSNQALDKLCATLNALEIRYPGTDLTLVYEAPRGPDVA